MQVINLISVDKSNLFPRLKELAKNLFCEENDAFDCHRIDTLVKSFKDDVYFLFEFPYIDEHFRDSYYLYYAEKFLEYKRNSIRIHIFDEKVDDKNFAEKQNSYLGYFIIRPLKQYILGHSFISPKAFKNNNFLCCLVKDAVHIMGNKFEVCAFPHVAQDTETQTCAESSLWSLLSYFGAKYRHYRPYKPSEIIEKLSNIVGHRVLPSKGLLLEELAACLNSCGQNCTVYCLNKKDEENTKNNFSLMRIYIESGMPFVVSLENEKAGHAVLAIGHEEIKPDRVLAYQSASKKAWMDVSEFDKKLVFIDDNCVPYSVDSCEKPALRYENFLQDMEISAFIVPFHKHMFIDAQMALGLLSMTFDDKKFGLKKFGSHWITRLLLTTGNSFKTSVEKDSLMGHNFKTFFTRMSVPKFIWLCEIYSADSYLEDKCVGLVLIDSTGNKKSLESVLFYCVNDSRMINDGISWIDQRNMPKFQKQTYRNNLKGAWNKWTA